MSDQKKIQEIYNEFANNTLTDAEVCLRYRREDIMAAIDLHEKYTQRDIFTKYEEFKEDGIFDKRVTAKINRRLVKLQQDIYSKKAFVNYFYSKALNKFKEYKE